MDIIRELKNRKEIIDEYLKECTKQNWIPGLLQEAMDYSIMAGGKRLRPVLVMEGAVLAGGCPDEVLPVAAALELIHTYSLIHDDLPCMDDDDLRRGKPTNHKVFGEAVATLAGDGLLTLAFEILARAENFSPDVRVKIIEEISRAAGPAGMVGGQVLDIKSEGRKLSLDELKKIHQLKTGALFRASLRSGALPFGPSKEELDNITLFSEAFGLLFQITDDLLDVEGDTEKLGKQVGRDEELNKATYPKILGLQKAREMADKVMDEALDALSSFGTRAEFLRSLTRFVRYREA